MKHLLCVMNARRIPRALESYEKLGCDVAYMTGFYIRDLVPVHADIVRQTDYDSYVMVSDDVVANVSAWLAVTKLLEEGAPAATGWCELVKGHRKVNLCKRPLIGYKPVPSAYPFFTRGQVTKGPGKTVQTHFMGMSLTGMPRDMWLQFPYGCFTMRHERGHSSDFHLSTRLRDAGVKMVAPKLGYVEHLKDRTGSWRGEGEQRLLVGEIKPEVTIVRYSDGFKTSLNPGEGREPRRSDETSPVPSETPSLHYLGGGYYELPDGSKVRGKAKAEEAMSAWR